MANLFNIILEDFTNQPTAIETGMKHRRTPQVNMGVNYIAKHNASMDENSEATQPSTTISKNFTKNINLRSTTISSTLKSYDNSTIYNVTTIATTKSAVEFFNTTEVPLTSLHNVIVGSSINHTENISKSSKSIHQSTSTTQTTRTSENDANLTTLIGKCPLTHNNNISFMYKHVPLTIIPLIILRIIA